MKKIICIFLFSIFLINFSYSYNECGVSYWKCKPWFRCDTYNNTCVADHSQCTRLYGSFSQMKGNGSCWCKLGYIIYNNKCDLFSQVCRHVFWNFAKQWNLLNSTCTCEDGYKFKQTEIRYLDPNDYSPFLNSCIPIDNIKSNIFEDESKINIDILLNDLYDIDIENLVSKGIISQSDDYKLQNNITRREMLKIMINISWLSIKSYCEGFFSDLWSNDWGCKYAETALKSWYIAPNTYFRPNDFITQAEVLKMLFQAKNISPNNNDNDWKDGYISKWKELWFFSELPNSDIKATRWFVFEITTKVIEEEEIDITDLLWDLYKE